jgi:NAD(P)-dependent dehydrogenase (short-subunit alcohol dehydrogenase family)
VPSALKGKVALVTGATSGIGQQVIRRLAASGARLVLSGRDPARLRRAAAQLPARRVLTIAADLRDGSSVTQMVERTLDRFGAPDILVNLAGVWHDGPQGYQGPRLWETPAERVLEVVEVGLLGAFRLVQGFLPAMIAGRGGQIVQIGCGFAGPHEAAGWLHYYVTNQALADFTRGLAAELRGTKVRINAIAPWFVATDAVKRIYPDQAKRALRPAAVAAAIVELLDGPFARNVSGQVIELRSDADV